MPVTTLMNVVLPEPLGPIRACTVPRSTARSTLDRAATPPKRLVSPRTSRTVPLPELVGRTAGRRISEGASGVAGRRAIESPGRSAAVDAAARRLAGGPHRRIDVGDTRLLAVPAVEDGRRV